MVRQLMTKSCRLGSVLALRVAFSRMALPRRARAAYVDRLIVGLKTKLAATDDPTEHETLIHAAESLEPLLKVRPGTMRRALASANDGWSVVEPMKMGRLTRLAARGVLAIWYPRGPARLALIERFIGQLNIRLAVLPDAADREALINEAETQFGPVLGIPSGIIRQRLTEPTHSG